MSQKLGRSERLLLGLLTRHLLRHGCVPSFKESARQYGCHHTYVGNHLKALARKGYVERRPGSIHFYPAGLRITCEVDGSHANAAALRWAAEEAEEEAEDNQQAAE